MGCLNPYTNQNSYQGRHRFLKEKQNYKETPSTCTTVQKQHLREAQVPHISCIYMQPECHCNAAEEQ